MMTGLLECGSGGKAHHVASERIHSKGNDAANFRPFMKQLCVEIIPESYVILSAGSTLFGTQDCANPPKFYNSDSIIWKPYATVSMYTCMYEKRFCITKLYCSAHQ